MRKKAFTLVEVLIAFAIFIVLIGMVLMVMVGGFRTFGQGQKIAQREQRKRIVFFRLGKELSSLTRTTHPQDYFEGDENSFFLFSTWRIT